MLINGIDEDYPTYCLSIFSFISILFAVSTTCLKSSIGKNTQYNFEGSVFLNTSKISGSPQIKSVATCLMHVTYAANVSVFSSK